MERFGSKAIDIINDLHTERLDYTSEYLPLIDAAQKLDDLENILGDYNLDRLRELVQADREGRCVVLPCKVGEFVYVIRESWDGYHIDHKKFKLGMADKFYKSVFLGKEEAESAMKAMKESESDG